MATRITLKSYFESGDKPTDVQFASLIDSFWHKTDDTLSVDWANVSSKPSTFTPSAHTHPWADISGKPTFATVATSGAYSDLSGLPTLFSGAWADLSGKPATFAPSAHVHAASDITSGVLASARLANGTATDGYMIAMVGGVPTWVIAPSGGGGSPAGLTGHVQFNNAGAFAANSLFFWDNSNNRLGIVTASPSYSLDVNGTARVQTVPTITTATKALVKDPTTGQISEQTFPAGGSGWGLAGNTGTTAGTNYVGTGDVTRFDIRANSVILGQFFPSGGVAFGDTASANVAGAFAAGYGASVSNVYGTAIGTFAQSNATGGMGFGNQARANHDYSIVIASKGAAPSFYASSAANQTLIGGYGGIDFQIQPGTNLFRMMSDSTIRAVLPTYADEAAAIAASVPSTTLYKTSTGEVRIKL